MMIRVGTQDTFLNSRYIQAIWIETRGEGHEVRARLRDGSIEALELFRTLEEARDYLETTVWRANGKR